ncbi:MAG: hypothetical protein JWO51_5023 [Rhodospirillales bacterium]|nr:hypothetical protein [Rhodospirillales bacterium]
MFFDTYGPYDLARDGREIPAKQPDMWAEIRAHSKQYDYPEKGLESAIGCYAFGLKNGTNYKPWYIGMTVAKRGFRGEILQPHKLAHYNTVVGSKKGTPVMFLFPLLTGNWHFSRDRGDSVPLVRWVEKMLFGIALTRNPECRNQRDTKFLRNVEVRGVFNSRQPGRSSEAMQAVRSMLGA